MNSGPFTPLMVVRLMVVPRPPRQAAGQQLSQPPRTAANVRGGCLVQRQIPSHDGDQERATSDRCPRWKPAAAASEHGGNDSGEARAGSGHNVSAGSEYEKGVNRISSSRLQHMARVLTVPISFFFEEAPGASSEERIRWRSPL